MIKIGNMMVNKNLKKKEPKTKEISKAPTVKDPLNKKPKGRPKSQIKGLDALKKKPLSALKKYY